MASIGAKAEVVTYPAGDGVLTSSDYTVEVRQGGDWQPVAVYPVSVFNVDKAKDAVERASMAYFDFDGPVEVRLVHHLGAVDKAAVRPLSRGIVPELSGDTISFSLTGSENLSVEINGDRFHNLHLFANPVDANRPTAKELKKLKKNKKFVYFAPGVHQLPGDTMRVESGTTVYVDGGARVYGAIIADGVRDVKIYGRGEVHPAGRGSGVNIRRSKNVEVDGLVTTQLPVGGSDSVRVSNVKAISSYNWGDGMNVFSSSNVHYDRVFCRNSDDCSTAYASTQGYKGSSRNVLVENSVLWADVAHPINVGGHGDRPEATPWRTSHTAISIFSTMPRSSSTIKAVWLSIPATMCWFAILFSRIYGWRISAGGSCSTSASVSTRNIACRWGVVLTMCCLRT